MSSNECFVWNNFHSIDRHPQHILGWMCYLYDTYDTDVWPQHPASLKKQLRSLSRERVVPNLRIFWHSEIAFFWCREKHGGVVCFSRVFVEKSTSWSQHGSGRLFVRRQKGICFFIRYCFEHKSWKLMVFDKDVQGQLFVQTQKRTWNLKMNPWKRRFLLKTIIFRFQPLVFRGGDLSF